MKKITAITVMSFFTVQLQAQNAITGVQTPCTAAAQGSAGKFIITYAIGEMPLITTQQSNGLIITQGVLQPFTFLADTVYECFSRTEVTVFPNPTTGNFSLRLNFFKKGNVKTLLFDAAGKLLQQNEFAYATFLTESYDIKRMPAGTYFLQLFFTETGSATPKKCVYTIQKM